MKNMKYISILLLSSIIAVSCITSKSVSIDEDYIAKYGFMMAKPQLVEIKVEKRKIEGRASIKNKLYGTEHVVSTAKKLAVIDAVKRGGADIIVQPVFRIDADRKYTNATVIGFAGTYVDFREITVSDTTAFYIRRVLDRYASIASGPTEKVVLKKKK